MNLADWTPRLRPGGTRLEGARIVLQPLDWRTHEAGLGAAVAGPDNAAIWTYMPMGPFNDVSCFGAEFEAVRAAMGWETLVIQGRHDGVITGMSSYMRIREEHGSAEIGCVAFGDRLKRSTEATEAMYLMARYVFEDLGYRRYEWKCHNENVASKRAAERLGFAFEGIFRNDMVVRGKNRDTAWFAMTDGEWPRLKAGFEAWLSPDNFDTDGRQKRTLEELQR